MQKKEVKAVLFDLDGVLIDSFDAWFFVFNDALSHFGLKRIDKRGFLKRFGGPLDKDLRECFAGWKTEDVVLQYEKYFPKRANFVKLYPESIPVLEKIRLMNLKTGLITNSTAGIVDSILRHYNLRKYFDIVTTMSDVGLGKPNPEMVLKTLKRLKAKPQNSLVIGDTLNDMIAGKLAGCTTVGYKIKGDYEIRKLRDILRILRDRD